MRIGCFAPYQISVSASVGASAPLHTEKNGSHDTIGTLGGRKSARAPTAATKAKPTTKVLEILFIIMFLLSYESQELDRDRPQLDA